MALLSSGNSNLAVVVVVGVTAGAWRWFSAALAMRMGGARAHQRSSPGRGVDAPRWKQGIGAIDVLTTLLPPRSVGNCRLRHSGHMLPASEVGMVSAAKSDEVCSVGFLEEGLFFFSGSGHVIIELVRVRKGFDQGLAVAEHQRRLPIVLI